MIESVWGHAPEKIFAAKQRYNDTDVRFSRLIHAPTLATDYDTPPHSVFGHIHSNQNMGDDGLENLLTILPKHHNEKALFLRGNALSDHGFLKLCQQLKYDATVQHLILSNNCIVISEFAKAGVMDLLKTNHYIGWLVLNDNHIDDKGVSHLCDGLELNTGIKHLVLSDNLLTDDGVVCLSKTLQHHPSIRSLFIAGNTITDVSVSSLNSLMASSDTLERIDIRGHNLSHSGLLSLLDSSHRYSVRLIYD